MKYTLITLAALSGISFGQTITTASISGTDDKGRDLNRLLNGDTSGGNFVGWNGGQPYNTTIPSFNIDLGGVYDLTSFSLWNNAGSVLTDAQGFKDLDLVFRNSGGNVISTLEIRSISSDGTSPFNQPLSVSNVASVDLNGVDSYFLSLGSSDFTLRQISFSGTAPVPEPSSTALLGLGGLALILRRKK